MKLLSPFRYPGAKSRLERRINAEFAWFPSVSDKTYVEPFIGGGAMLCGFVSRYGLPKRIVVNDMDSGVAAFWKCLTDQSQTDELSDRVSGVSEWSDCEMLAAHDRYQKLPTASSDSVGAAFETLFLNRTSFSGILKSGPLGGHHQNGRHGGIRSRFNAAELAARITTLRRVIGSILEVRNEDFADVMLSEDHPNTLMYLDPPYYDKGKQCYRCYAHEDHQRLAQIIGEIKRACVLLSYDDHPQIHELYKHAIRDKITASYSISANRQTSPTKPELLIRFRRAVQLQATDPVAAQAEKESLLQEILKRFAIVEEARKAAVRMAG